MVRHVLRIGQRQDETFVDGREEDEIAVWRDPLDGADMVAAADPLTWTRAPLFVVQSAGRESAVPLQSDGKPDTATAAAPVRDQGPVASPTDGLFVARSVSGGPR